MTELDQHLFLSLSSALSTVPDWVLRGISALGHGGWLALIALPTLLILTRGGNPKRAVVGLILSVAMSGIVVWTLKLGIDRPRPVETFDPGSLGPSAASGPRGRSFPSGHTQTAFAAAAFFCALTPRAAPLLLVAAAVGLSRIGLGVHFPADVLVGAVIGGLGGGFGGVLTQRGERALIRPARGPPPRTPRAE